MPLTLEPNEVRRDVRARRPQLTGALRQSRAPQRFARFASLLALDFGAVFAAIFTALAVKELVRGNFELDKVSGQAWEYFPFVFLITALVFALSGLYGSREERAGLTAITSGLFWVVVVVRVRDRGGLDFQSYYIFYGGFVFAVAWVGGMRWLYEKATDLTLAALGRSRRTILVGSGEQIEAGRACTFRQRLGHPLRTARLHLAYSSSRTGCATSAGSTTFLTSSMSTRCTRSSSPTPTSPEEEAFELVDRCNERGVAVRIAPTTMEILTHEHQLVPGQTVPLFELKQPAFEGMDFVVKRVFDLTGASLLLIALSPLLATIALTVKLTSRGPCSSAAAGPASAASRSTCSSAPCTPTRNGARPNSSARTRPAVRFSRSREIRV